MREYRFGRSRVATSFEAYSWLFMQISGVLLLFFVSLHFTLMHFSLDISISPLARRLYELVMLFLAVLHGANGLRVVSDDFIHEDPFRTLSLAFLSLATIALLLIGLSNALD